MKILLAVDTSFFSLTAAEAVAARPWPPGSIVRIVHVSDSAGVPVDVNLARILPPFPPPPYAILKAAGRLEGCPIKVEAKILRGRPKPAILREAREWGADLIVVGSHGISGLERLLFGSLSLAVAASSPCSVEIVRPTANRKSSLRLAS